MSLWPIFTAFLLSALGNWYLANPGRLTGFIAEPNHRSLHDRPVPASGGLAMLSALTVSGAAWFWLAETACPPALFWLLGGAALVALVSLLDDWRPLPAWFRLIAHLLAAWLLLVPGGYLPETLSLPGWQWHWPSGLALVLCLLGCVWLINLYNFMDGMDGFAGGMAIFGFTTHALLGLLAGSPLFVLLNLMVMAVAAGFLLFNFPPAKIFMGDSGASLLGFLAVAGGLWAEAGGLFPLWLSMLVFSPFIVDATITLLRRLARREKLWQAHREHYYQRLVRLGWGHRKTVLAEYLVMLGCCLSALLAWWISPAGQWLILLAWAGLYSLLTLGVHQLEQRSG